MNQVEEKELICRYFNAKKFRAYELYSDASEVQACLYRPGKAGMMEAVLPSGGQLELELPNSWQQEGSEELAGLNPAPKAKAKAKVMKRPAGLGASADE